MYPFKIDHIYFETVWGGLSMESFRDDHKGMSLQDLISNKID